MAIQDAGDDVRAVDAGFCTECGAQLAGGRFCAHCGHAVGEGVPFPRHDAAAQRGAAAAAEPVYEHPDVYDAPPYPAPYANGNGNGAPPVGATQTPPRRRWPIVVGIVVVLVALAGAGAAIFLTSKDSSDDGAAAAEYRTKVADTLAPMNSANERLSESLADLRRGRAAKQRDAVSAAQDATSSARGALGAIEVPQGGESVAQQARQAIVREETYLKAVSNVLARPTDPGLSELQPLAGNLTSALEAVDAPIPNAAQNVRGVQTLTRWAMKERRIREQQGLQASTTTAPPATNTPPPDPGAIDNPCGNDIYVNSTTTCPFAMNVKEAWLDAPGIENTITAYSSSTGRDITMNCGRSAGQIVCSGGTNARVAWTW